MGKCVYCGESAGLFRSKHKHCEVAHKDALTEIQKLSEQAIIAHDQPEEVKAQIDSWRASGAVGKPALERAIALGVANALEHFLDDNILSQEEEQSLTKYLGILPISNDTVQDSGLAAKIVKASIIRSLSNGEVPDPNIAIDGNLPFLFQKSEKLIWVFKGVKYLEQVTRSEYRGGSQGVSIRVTKGVYYRTGAFKGRKVEVEELKDRGTGLVALTTKHIYFGSSQTSFKIPYSKIVALQTYSDGIQVQKDGLRSKPQIFKGLDGWFASNIVSNLNG